MELQKKRNIFYNCAPKPTKLPLLDYTDGILDLAYSEFSCGFRTMKWIQNNYLPGDILLLTCHQKFCLGMTGQLFISHTLSLSSYNSEIEKKNSWTKEALMGRHRRR